MTAHRDGSLGPSSGITDISYLPKSGPIISRPGVLATVSGGGLFLDGQEVSERKRWEFEKGVPRVGGLSTRESLSWRSEVEFGKWPRHRRQTEILPSKNRAGAEGHVMLTCTEGTMFCS